MNKPDEPNLLYLFSGEMKREKEFYRLRGLACPKDLLANNDEADADARKAVDQASNDVDFHRFDEQVLIKLSLIPPLTIRFVLFFHLSQSKNTRSYSLKLNRLRGATIWFHRSRNQSAVKFIFVPRAYFKWPFLSIKNSVLQLRNFYVFSEGQTIWFICTTVFIL